MTIQNLHNHLQSKTVITYTSDGVGLNTLRAHLQTPKRYFGSKVLFFGTQSTQWFVEDLRVLIEQCPQFVVLLIVSHWNIYNNSEENY